MRFFALILGRPQNLLEFKIFTRSGKNHRTFRVYDSGFPKFQRLDNESNPYPGDVLMDAVQDPDGFSDVLKAWLERENDWGIARGSFFQFFEKQTRYDQPRLINAANMFDLMPIEVFTEQNLQQSADNDSVLNASGRGGNLTLKRKIHFRVSLLSARIGDRLPELSLVTDEAVNCRNYYVHGGPSRINYENESSTRVFFYAITGVRFCRYGSYRS